MEQFIEKVLATRRTQLEQLIDFLRTGRTAEGVSVLKYAGFLNDSELAELESLLEKEYEEVR